jgi:hypothetical protein
MLRCNRYAHNIAQRLKCWHHLSLLDLKGGNLMKTGGSFFLVIFSLDQFLQVLVWFLAVGGGEFLQHRMSHCSNGDGFGGGHPITSFLCFSNHS